jgi:hypothetical protein
MADCAETRELLETAALERDGIERLEAGDTIAAARAAGHLAICPPCAEELRRLRRTAGALRAALEAGPPPALRERTLALVRAAGVERGTAGPGAPLAANGPVVEPTVSPVRDPVTTSGPATAPGQPVVAAAAPGSASGRASLPPGPAVVRQSRRSAAPAWLAAIAAVLIMGAFGAGAIVGLQAGPAAGPTAAPEPALARVTGTHARIMASADGVEVVLLDPSGVPRGLLAVAPSSGEMVAVAGGLGPAPAGATYRCWIEAEGRRTTLGTMYLAGDVGWWAGPVALKGPIAPGTRFGVSVVTPDGYLGEPVLLGSY